MTDALPDDAWVNSFLSASPRPLQQALQKRLHGAQTHVNALAELYKQRAVIEAHYADSLAKLARSAEQGLLNGKGAVEWDKVGGEARLWENVVSEISETSSAHSTLAALVRTDFEQVIRELPSKIISWRRIGEQDTSLEKALKDYEKTAGKLDKAQSKGGKGGKADMLGAELNQITSNLSSLSPMVYTTYQRLDEERLRALKEVIVRWGTVRADMAQRDGERAERAVAQMISWETPDEVAAVGRRLATKAGGSPPSGGGQPPQPTSAQSTPRTDRRLSTSTSHTNDFSPRPQPRQNGSSTNLSTSGGSFAGGLKSMLSRRPTLGPSGRGRSGSNAPSVRSGRDRDGAGFAAIGEDDPIPPRNVQTPPPVDAEGFSVAPADRHRNPWEDPNELIPDRPGSSNHESAPSQPAAADAAPSSAFSNTFTSSPTASAEDINVMGSVSTQAPKMNLALTSAPIQEDEADRQAAMQKMQQTLQMSPTPQPTRRQTVARGRRDVRNTVFAGASEDGSLGYGGFGIPEPKVADSATVAPSSRQASNESRPSTAGAPNGLTVGGPGIMRQTSLSSVSSNNPFDSPGLTNPASSIALDTTTDAGLRAAVTEHVNCVMHNGTVRRIQITGEIRLSLRATSSGPSHGPIHVKLDRFEALEKIAPNPNFVAQVPDKAGEYFLNSEALASATSSASTQGTLAFRYQVFVQPGSEAEFVPITLEPAFLCKQGETRMILHYKAGKPGALANGTLQKVSFVAAFGPGPSVSNVQAKPPGGVWSAAARQIAWDMGDLTDDGKVIAKFVSTGDEALAPKGIQVAWTMPGLLGSGLGLEVVKGDLESDWSFADVQKQLSSGKYLAEPMINQ